MNSNLGKWSMTYKESQIKKPWFYLIIQCDFPTPAGINFFQDCNMGCKWWSCANVHCNISGRHLHCELSLPVLRSCVVSVARELCYSSHNNIGITLISMITLLCLNRIQRKKKQKTMQTEFVLLGLALVCDIITLENVCIKTL